MYNKEQRLLLYQKFMSFYQEVSNIRQITFIEYFELMHPEINIKRDLPELKSKLKWYRWYDNDDRIDLLRECIWELQNPNGVVKVHPNNRVRKHFQKENNNPAGNETSSRNSEDYFGIPYIPITFGSIDSSPSFSGFGSGDFGGAGATGSWSDSSDSSDSGGSDGGCDGGGD